MNKFEEFVKELKQENLLEDTVIDSKSNNKSKESLAKDESNKKIRISSKKVGRGDFEESVEEIKFKSGEGIESGSSEREAETEKQLGGTEGIIDNNIYDNNSEKKRAYKQKLIDMVSSLQMVDHALVSVQREQMRTRPKIFNAVKVKQSLHKFVEAFEKLEVPEKTPEETTLVKEIKLWNSALLEIDEKIPVKKFRLYCESTKPKLSKTSLTSMARFYRKAPFSDQTRCKFDLVATRLFTKEVENNKRKLILERDELIERIKEFYTNWAINSFHSEDEDPEIILAAFKFEDFISEVSDIKKFDEFIKKGLFKRLKLFKKKINEKFFTPLLVAASVESNVIIGNRYIELTHADEFMSKVLD